MPTTTNYGWTTPADTDLVKDGAAAIRTLGTAIDTTTYNNANAAIAKTIVDAKGDIIAATAADTVSRLAVGANDTVLTADSSTATGLKWASAASGGMTLISTTSLTGAAINLTSIPQDYNSLRLVIRQYKPATDGDRFAYRYNGDSNANRYRNAEYQTDFEGSSAFNQSYLWTAPQDDTTATGLIVLNFPDYTNATTWKWNDIVALSVSNTDTSEFRVFKAIGIYNQTAAVTQINLVNFTGGNFTSGTAYLYGVK